MKRPVIRKLPISPEILLRFYKMMYFPRDGRLFALTWVSLVLGFAPFLLGSEARALKRRGMVRYQEEPMPFLTISAQRRKADQ